jgi:hypothetical protein
MELFSTMYDLPLTIPMGVTKQNGWILTTLFQFSSTNLVLNTWFHLGGGESCLLKIKDCQFIISEKPQCWFANMLKEVNDLTSTWIKEMLFFVSFTGVITTGLSQFSGDFM